VNGKIFLRVPVQPDDWGTAWDDLKALSDQEREEILKSHT
jgi:hypothetical protein